MKINVSNIWLTFNTKVQISDRFYFPLQVHIRDEMYVIHCGNGQQKVEWLGDTACHRYDPDYLWDVGTVQDIRLKNGV